MTPEEAAADPAVRAAVFATVTVAEAYDILHSRPGKPWCDALLVNVTDDMDARLNHPEPFPQAESIGDGARKVLGLPQSFAREQAQEIMTTTDDQVRAGELYETPDSVLIRVLRVARTHEWADTKMMQQNGASWSKRQPLVDGRFSFEAERKKEAR